MPRVRVPRGSADGFTYELDYDTDPFPGTETYRDQGVSELTRYPRNPEHIPDWLQRNLQLSGQVDPYAWMG